MTLIKVMKEVAIPQCDFCGTIEHVSRYCETCMKHFCSDCSPHTADLHIYHELMGNYNETICKECLDKFKFTTGRKMYEIYQNMVKETEEFDKLRDEYLYGVTNDHN